MQEAPTRRLSNGALAETRAESFPCSARRTEILCRSNQIVCALPQDGRHRGNRVSESPHQPAA